MIATRYEMERYMFSEDANIPYADILGIEKDEVEEVTITDKPQSQPKSEKKPKVDKDYKNQLFDDLFGDKK